MARDGECFRVRSIGPTDRDAVASVFARMSHESRRLRFLATKPRLTETELTYLTAVDHATHEALAAIDRDGRMVAIARYVSDVSLPYTAEVAVEVVDDHHGRGLGAALVRHVVDRARENGYRRLTATMLWQNQPARALFRKLGFRVRGAGQGLLDLELDLEAPGQAVPVPAA